MSSNLPYKQASNVERRTWNKDIYEAKAKARLAAVAENLPVNEKASKRHKINTTIAGTSEDTCDDSRAKLKEEFQPAEVGAQGPMFSQRAFLKARREKVDLESKIGTTEIIHPDAVATSAISSNNLGNHITEGVKKAVNGVGWHCEVCDCFLRDSLTYLDHINGRKHQRALGYSMRIAKSTKHEVVSKLERLANEQKESHEKCNNNEESKLIEFEEMIRSKDEGIEQRKAERKKRREERKKMLERHSMENETAAECVEEEECDEDASSDIMKVMGFQKFGGA